MLKYLLLVLISTPLIASSQSASVGGGDELSSYTNGRFDVYKKDASYIVIKLRNTDEQLTEKGKTKFTNIQKLLTAKGVTSIDHQWKTKEDIENLFKTYGLAAEVSVANGLNIKMENIQMNSTDNNAVLIIENKKAKSICAGDNCEDIFLKRYFEIKQSGKVD